MSTHSFEVELNTEYRTAVRFPAWMVLSVFSAVALAAVASRFKKDDRGADVRWALAVTTLSMIFGLFGNLGYLFVRGIFVGQLPEMVLVSANCILTGKGGTPWWMGLYLQLARFFYLPCPFYRLPWSLPFGVWDCQPL
jgi:hypothetical protein